MTSTEVSKRTGVHRGVIAAWVKSGLLRPSGGRSFGPGDPLHFDEADVVRVRALVALRRAFGDGELARIAIEQTLPLVSTSTTALRIERIEIPLEVA